MLLSIAFKSTRALHKAQNTDVSENWQKRVLRELRSLRKSDHLADGKGEDHEEFTGDKPDFAVFPSKER